MDQRLFTIGVNHETAPVAVREGLAYAESELSGTSRAAEANFQCKAPSSAGWTSHRSGYPTMRCITFADPSRSCIRSAAPLFRPRDIQYEVFGPDLWQADYE
jgi:hypothetical protein